MPRSAPYILIVTVIGFSILAQNAYGNPPGIGYPKTGVTTRYEKPSSFPNSHNNRPKFFQPSKGAIQQIKNYSKRTSPSLLRQKGKNANINGSVGIRWVNRNNGPDMANRNRRLDNFSYEIRMPRKSKGIIGSAGGGGGIFGKIFNKFKGYIKKFNKLGKDGRTGLEKDMNALSSDVASDTLKTAKKIVNVARYGGVGGLIISKIEEETGVHPIENNYGFLPELISNEVEKETGINPIGVAENIAINIAIDLGSAGIAQGPIGVLKHLAGEELEKKFGINPVAILEKGPAQVIQNKILNDTEEKLGLEKGTFKRIGMEMARQALLMQSGGFIPENEF